MPQEILLVNDGSTDETLEILKEIEKLYNNVVKVINLKENKGASYARNFGVKNAKGDYILFMDADDIAEPELLEKYFHRLEKLNYNGDDRYILCYSDYIQIDEKNNQISDIVRGIQVEPEEILGYEFVRNYIISTSGILIKRNFFLKSGGFNENLIYSEDWDLWLRLACLGGFAYVDEPLIRVRRHTSNISSNINKMLEGERIVLKQYDLNYIKKAILKRNLLLEKNIVDYVSVLFKLDYWQEGFSELISLLKKGCNYYNLFFYLGLYYLKQEKIDIAIEYFRKTIKLKPTHGAALNNLGALYIFKGSKKLAEKYLKLAIKYFPSYIDANHNFNIIYKENVLLDNLKFTWRELREVLTKY